MTDFLAIGKFNQWIFTISIREVHCIYQSDHFGRWSPDCGGIIGANNNVGHAVTNPDFSLPVILPKIPRCFDGGGYGDNGAEKWGELIGRSAKCEHDRSWV
jgi:hypothetical protein